MSTHVRSHAKINLGLAIGPSRPDGFHALMTIYQTLAIHDFVDVTAMALPSGAPSEIFLSCTEKFVPCDDRNTCWKIVERALDRLNISAKVKSISKSAFPSKVAWEQAPPTLSPL